MARIEQPKKSDSLYSVECPVCHESFDFTDELIEKRTKSSKSGKVTARTIIHKECANHWPGMQQIDEKYIKRAK